jgi:hypothetical protein
MREPRDTGIRGEGEGKTPSFAKATDGKKSLRTKSWVSTGRVASSKFKKQQEYRHDIPWLKSDNFKNI